MKHKTILVVPPRGIPLKAFKIRFSVAIVFIVVVIVGFTGLVLPLEILTNDVAEQNQRKNLTEQNRALLQKVISTLRMLKDLKAQIATLEMKQMHVAGVTGNDVLEPGEVKHDVDYRKLKSDEMLSYVGLLESRFAPFNRQLSDSLNLFDNIPILRPVPAPAMISRRFGISLDPFSGKRLHHNGTDFVAEAGAPIVATAAGVVKRVEKHAIWGIRIVIDHDNEYSTCYAHLGSYRTAKGRRVKRGEVIGELGSSGLSSGPHVHYEVWRNGEAVNPEHYFFPSELVSSE